MYTPVHYACRRFLKMIVHNFVYCEDFHEQFLRMHHIARAFDFSW